MQLIQLLASSVVCSMFVEKQIVVFYITFKSLFFFAAITYSIKSN